MDLKKARVLITGGSCGDKQEIGFGPTENLQEMIAAQETFFKSSAARFPVETYT